MSNSARLIGKGGMAVEGQPAKLMGMSVEQQHACAQQGFLGRSREEASRTVNKGGGDRPFRASTSLGSQKARIHFS